LPLPHRPHTAPQTEKEAVLNRAELAMWIDDLRVIVASGSLRGRKLHLPDGRTVVADRWAAHLLQVVDDLRATRGSSARWFEYNVTRARDLALALEILHDLLRGDEVQQPPRPLRIEFWCRESPRRSPDQDPALVITLIKDGCILNTNSP
jgi:hypothetical protein